MKIKSLLKIIVAFLFFVPFASFSANPCDTIKNQSIFIPKKVKKSSATITPPVIIATGNQNYCPGTNLKIVESVVITFDPLEPETDAVTIQISSGYVNGQDKLVLTNSTLHPNIKDDWSDLEGKLTLSSTTGSKIPYADFELAIKDVAFSNSSTSPSGVRTFSINLGVGQLSYLPRNDHYYEYVTALGITWTAARDAAALKKYYDLQGYLATLTAADEAQLAGAQAPGAGWIGGSDAQNEGVWKWVTGPEGAENDGNGVVFWNGGVGGSSPPNQFAFWNTGEPNQFSGRPENYAHVTRPFFTNGVPSVNNGRWNDLTNTGDASGDYQPKGYIVEYGGMPGDPNLQISASTTITIPKITVITPGSRCGSGTVLLKASATNGVINWYDEPTGGILLETGNSFTTPSLNDTTSYYIDISNGSCPRTEIMATITTLPSLPQILTSPTSPVAYCLNALPIPLSATASVDCKLNWYTLPNGGIASTTSPIPTTTVAGSTTYYVSQTNIVSGCESPRAAIVVTVNPLPAAPSVTAISYCNNEASVPLTATASANCTLNWYTTATGGSPMATSPTPSTIAVGLTTYYVSQTLIATGCEGPRAAITVTVNPLPTAPIVSDIVYCKNETAIPLRATASINCALNWYTTATSGSPSATNPIPSTATAGSTTYFVSQTLIATGCEGPRSEILVTVYPLPIVNEITITQCDSDLVVDGKTLFNLTVNNDKISANYQNETFTYYTSLNGANNADPADLISNELAFENTTETFMDVWSRVANTITGCHSVSKIKLVVPATNISPNYKIKILPVCDDFLDVNGDNTANNNKRDGIATFDLTASKAEIQNLLPAADKYTINYYKNEADALAQSNVITNISNYRNIDYPNSQDIWIRIDSNIDNACYGLGPYLTLNVEALPVANTVIIPRQCDDNSDGIFTFNTSSLETEVLKGQTNVTVTYFDQDNNPLKDANGFLITSPFPENFTSTSQTIKAVVTNSTTQQCFDETTIVFIVDASPIANAISSALTTACDDEANPADQDGQLTFDTTGFETLILGGQTGMIVKYFDANNLELDGPLPNPFITSTQDITARVENPLNTNCTAITTLKFVVNPIPNIDLNEDGLSDKLVCSNLPTFFVTLDAGIQDGSPTSNYNYIWTKNGISTGPNAPKLNVNTEGIYTVEVTNNSGCGTIRTIAVVASNTATIVSIDIEDLTDNNTITINATGPGDYQYSLDEPDGFWQDSNFFNNVPAGIHVVYINDKNGCGFVHQEIIVVGVPKFFTPNGDGFNDYWSVKGVNDTFNSKSTIYIFDRYGKLLKQWVPYLNKGWDGTFNGIPLPADDYWYTLKLEDGREKKGHFSLKR